MRILKTIPLIFTKNIWKRSLDVKSTIARHTASNPGASNIKPFCHQYWRDIVDLQHYNRGNLSCVEYHGYLNGINHHLTTGVNPEGLTQPFMHLGITPKEMIEITDAQFKTVPKTREVITAYRCVGEKPEIFKQDYARYIKSLKVKKGDIVTMPEYAYATSDIEYANIYLNNAKGIRYVIEIPAESRISIKGYGKNNEIAFPRCSQFECTGTEQQGNVLVVRLKYIKPMDYME